MNKQRIIVTTIASSILWAISLYLQVIVDLVILKRPLLGSSCSGTGYPFAVCSTNQIVVWSLAILNIAIIATAINLIWNSRK